MKKRIAIVNQRYGLEVNGGSEVLTRMLAERLNPFYDIEVITTCALDYMEWKNYYPEGVSDVNGVKVRRFIVEKQRDMEHFLNVHYCILDGYDLEQEWVDEQGPYCPGAVEYIKNNKDNFDVFIFFTYLYYLTVRGITSVKNKVILIPTAHDEPQIYFNVFREIFNVPKAIVFCTEEERDFIHELFQNQKIPNDIIGVGIDTPKKAKPKKFKKKYNLTNYLIYAGRIDIGKNCPELFKFFIEYKRLNPSDLKLVLIGQEIIAIPNHPDIISLGFVSDKDKINSMAGAKLLVMPSYHESLSIVVLESMISGVPVLVHGKCEVLTGHCIKSNAGLYYINYNEFEGCINYLLNDNDVYEKMGKNGKEYVEMNYRWDVIISKLKDLIESMPIY